MNDEIALEMLDELKALNGNLKTKNEILNSIREELRLIRGNM